MLLRAALPLFLIAAASGQTSKPAVRFEVVSVKLSLNPLEMRAKGPLPRQTSDPGHFQSYTSLGNLIKRAYALEPYQDLSGPDWINTTYYEIAAKLPDGATAAQIPEMLQALLAERFGLVARRETAERPIYNLVVAKDGPKLKEAPAGDLTSEKPFPDGANGRILLVISNLGADGWQTYSMLNGTTMFDAARITMPRLATVLSRQVDLPVIDRTGLTGSYQISMAVPHGPNGARPVAARGGAPGGPDSAAPPTQASDPGADIFKSVEKLGLHLEKTKGSIENLVVEHVEKTPTEN